MKNLSIRTKTLFLLFTMLLLAALPLIAYSVATMKGLSRLGWDRDIEATLEQSLQQAATASDKENAAVSLMKYRQIHALKQGITDQVLTVSLLYFGIIIFLSLSAGWFFTTRITRPLRQLTEATKRIAADNLDATLINQAGGEMAHLIDSFNKMIKDLKIAREQHRLNERRSAWRLVARTLAHEIKNPLTPIRLSTERLYEKFLGKSPDFPEVIQSTTQTILSEIANLERLVNAFHQYAKFPDPMLKLESLNSIAEECTTLYKHPDYDLDLRLCPALPLLPLDRGQMRQALGNLLKNAAQSFEKNGQRGRIILTTAREDNRIRLSVQDNGCGISEENRKQLFQPYFTTKPQGSGLGLPLTERIVNVNGGRIFCESSEEKGSLFTLEFKTAET